MMNSQATSRIVIGAGLAVVFGIGVSIIMDQGTQYQAARNAPPAAALTDRTANPPAADAAASFGNAATAAVAPSAVASPGSLASSLPDAANRAALNGTNSASSGSDANGSSASSSDTNVPKPKHASHLAQSTAGVKKSSASPNESDLETAHGDSGIGVTTPSSPPAANDALADTTTTTTAPIAEARPAPEHSTDSSESGADTDGQIAAQVRSSIANLAPGSSIDVKASSGIVALAGSVASQNVVEQARQAAQQVPGVRQVDTSALTVQNQ